MVNAKLKDAIAIGPHLVNVGQTSSNERSRAKEYRAMAQTVHLLDFQPMNFQQLSVIEASFLFPHNIESMLDEFMLPEGQSFDPPSSLAGRECSWPEEHSSSEAKRIECSSVGHAARLGSGSRAV